MMFGEPKEFAIEAYHEPYAQEYAGFGRMCIHVKGITIGKIRENHCSLFHAVDRFRKLRKGIDRLWEDGFSNHSDTEIWNILEKALYLDNGQSMTEMKADWKRLGRYVFLTNTGEPFDGFGTFIICRPGPKVHVLYRKHKENAQGSVSCEIDAFRTVAKTFVKWFDEQVRKTAPPFFPINPFDLNEKVPDDWAEG